MARQTDQKRKAAALADLLTGEQPAIVAARYRFNPATVRSWKARLDSSDGGIATGVATPVATNTRRPAREFQQQAIGELIMENLRAKLIATQRIAEYATIPAWFDKQTAADVATLFEALDRSAVGILDRLAQRASADGSADERRDPTLS